MKKSGIPAMLYRLAVAHRKHRQPAATRHVLEDALQMNPKFNRPGQARQLVTELRSAPNGKRCVSGVVVCHGSASNERHKNHLGC